MSDIGDPGKKKGRKKGKGRKRAKKGSRTPCGMITISSGKVRRRYHKIAAATKAVRSLTRRGHAVRATFGRACKVK